MAVKIDQIHHSKYSVNILDWHKWRTCYKGGYNFKKTYLKRLSIREDDEDYNRRFEITPIPRFAGTAIDEVVNSITVRLPDVKRMDGPKLYLQMCNGEKGGVDQRGLTMNGFVAQQILPEMLTMGRVGVFVDRKPLPEGATLKEANEAPCYMYYYPVEDILSWETCFNYGQVSYKKLLLRCMASTYDTETGLPTGLETVYRRFWINEQGTVSMQVYKLEENPEWNPSVQNSSKYEYMPGPITTLKLKTIPFVDFAINKPLMEDIADYQIALLNMESADVAYAYGANFPFYTEQYDPLQTMQHLKKIDPVTGEEVAV